MKNEYLTCIFASYRRKIFQVSDPELFARLAFKLCIAWCSISVVGFSLPLQNELWCLSTKRLGNQREARAICMEVMCLQQLALHRLLSNMAPMDITRTIPCHNCPRIAAKVDPHEGKGL